MRLFNIDDHLTMALHQYLAYNLWLDSNKILLVAQSSIKYQETNIQIEITKSSRGGSEWQKSPGNKHKIKNILYIQTNIKILLVAQSGKNHQEIK